MDEISYDVLEFLMSFLPPIPYLIRFQRVNKNWRLLCQMCISTFCTEIVWCGETGSGYEKNASPKDVDIIQRKLIFGKFQNVSKMILQNVLVTEENMLDIALNMKKLEKLVFSNCNFHGFKVPSFFQKTNPTKKEFLEQMEKKKELFINKVEFLGLYDCRMLSYENVFSYFCLGKFPKLKLIDIRYFLFKDIVFNELMIVLKEYVGMVPGVTVIENEYGLNISIESLNKQEFPNRDVIVVAKRPFTWYKKKAKPINKKEDILKTKESPKMKQATEEEWIQLLHKELKLNKYILSKMKIDFKVYDDPRNENFSFGNKLLAFFYSNLFFGTDFSLVDIHGETLIFKFAKSNDFRMFEFAIKYISHFSANEVHKIFHRINYHGQTILSIILGRGRIKFVELFLDHFKYINMQDAGGNTIFHCLSRMGKFNGFKKIVNYCRRRGVKIDLNVQNKNGKTVLHHAVEKGMRDMYYFFLDEMKVRKDLKDINGKIASEYLKINESLHRSWYEDEKMNKEKKEKARLDELKKIQEKKNGNGSLVNPMEGVNSSEIQNPTSPKVSKKDDKKCSIN